MPRNRTRELEAAERAPVRRPIPSDGKPRKNVAAIEGGKYNTRGQNARYTNITLLAKIALSIKNGNSKSDSMRRYGVSPDVGFEWLSKGKAGHHPILVKFQRIVERAWAHYNSQMVGAVDTAAKSGAPNTWQAAMTMLERRDPANWGRRDTSKIKVEADQPLVQLNQVVLADTDARDKLRSVLRGVAGPRAHESIGPGVGDELTEGDTLGESE